MSPFGLKFSRMILSKLVLNHLPTLRMKTLHGISPCFYNRRRAKSSSAKNSDAMNMSVPPTTDNPPRAYPGNTPPKGDIEHNHLKQTDRSAKPQGFAPSEVGKRPNGGATANDDEYDLVGPKGTLDNPGEYDLIGPKNTEDNLDEYIYYHEDEKPSSGAGAGFVNDIRTPPTGQNQPRNYEKLNGPVDSGEDYVYVDRVPQNQDQDNDYQETLIDNELYKPIEEDQRLASSPRDGDGELGENELYVPSTSL